MRKHPTDLLSFLAGVFFVTIGAVAALTTDPDGLFGVGAESRWVGPVLLVAVGALGLAASVRRPVEDEVEQKD